MTKLWKWLKSLCKCSKRCKCMHCRAWNWSKNKASKLSAWFWNNLPEQELLKGLGLVGASAWLWFTGSLECTAGFLLLGWGLLEILDWLRWK